MGSISGNAMIINPVEEETSEIVAVKEELSRIGVLRAGNDRTGVRQISSYVRGGSKFITLQLSKHEFWSMYAGTALQKLSSIPNSIDLNQFMKLVKFAELEPAKIVSTADAVASN